MSESVFQALDVVKTYRNHNALDSFSMNVPAGSIYGFIGENGAGKTTLIRLLAGLDFPTHGKLSLFGESTERGLMQQRARTGFIVESPALYMDMTARQNMEMIRTQRGIPEKNSVNNMLELLSLQDTNTKKVRNFSLGMRQRLGLAMALIGEPEFLILDEPINGLDPTGILEFRNLISTLNNEKRTTILISSHILSELDSMATHYGFIHRGKMVQEISAKALSEQCKRYLLLRVSHPEKASALLEMEFHSKQFEVYPDQSVHIYDLIDRGAEITSCFVENKIEIQEMTICGDNLETYFEKLIGGA